MAVILGVNMRLSDFVCFEATVPELAASERDDVVLGVGDDCALLSPPRNQQLAVTVDTLVSGVHFPESTSPKNIAYKSLAVSLSDLAAMGAKPAWATLALTLPKSNESG